MTRAFAYVSICISTWIETVIISASSISNATHVRKNVRCASKIYVGSILTINVGNFPACTYTTKISQPTRSCTGFSTCLCERNPSKNYRKLFDVKLVPDSISHKLFCSVIYNDVQSIVGNWLMAITYFLHYGKEVLFKLIRRKINALKINHSTMYL